MKPHESPRIRKKSIRGDSGDSWPVWNRGIRNLVRITHDFSKRGIRGQSFEQFKTFEPNSR